MLGHLLPVSWLSNPVLCRVDSLARTPLLPEVSQEIHPSRNAHHHHYSFDFSGTRRKRLCPLLSWKVQFLSGSTSKWGKCTLSLEAALLRDWIFIRSAGSGCLRTEVSSGWNVSSDPLWQIPDLRIFYASKIKKQGPYANKPQNEERNILRMWREL